jgi:DeoR/GlpR family transcriptional regulator of sugar metabolism
LSKKAHRQELILSALDTNPSLRVSMLAEELGVSSETVRRDLAELDDTGRLRRTYGGAVRTSTLEPALAVRSQLFVRERELIARVAIERMGEVGTLFIGGGATTLHFARALRASERALTVLTPALSIAAELSANPRIQVMMLPGIVEPAEGLVYGAETIRSIGQFRTPLAVVGASALDGEGVSEALLHAAQVYSAMTEAANETLVLADSSKFGDRSLQQILQWRPGMCLVTERAPEPELAEKLRGAGAELLVG